MIKDDNYYIIHGWMLKLDLKGYQLPVYAIIYGFSQDARSEFSGSLTYLAEFTNCSRRNVIRTLQQLEDLRLIVKRSYIDGGVTRCFYKAVKPSDAMSSVVTQCHQGSDVSSPGVVTQCHQGSDTMSPNKEYIKNYIENSKSSSDEQNPIVLYERMMGPINMEIAEDIIEICETCGYENLEKALARAREQHTKNITYIRNAAKGIAAGIDFKEMAERKASKEKKGSLLWSV